MWGGFFFCGETWRKTKMKTECRIVGSIPNVHGFINAASSLHAYANCIQLSRAHYFTLFYAWHTDHCTSLYVQVNVVTHFSILIYKWPGLPWTFTVPLCIWHQTNTSDLSFVNFPVSVLIHWEVFCAWEMVRNNLSLNCQKQTWWFSKTYSTCLSV